MLEAEKICLEILRIGLWSEALLELIPNVPKERVPPRVSLKSSEADLNLYLLKQRSSSPQVRAVLHCKPRCSSQREQGGSALSLADRQRGQSE